MSENACCKGVATTAAAVRKAWLIAKAEISTSSISQADRSADGEEEFEDEVTAAIVAAAIVRTGWQTPSNARHRAS
ncbi:hypothetical protein LRN53_14560, partial [Staphylococcus aureus]|uniref:hypothetical protein n=1 Tax=Staphylococcus aureus TaxID=1280 RepID=UPI001E305E74